MKKSKMITTVAIAALALGTAATTAQAEDTVATFEVTSTGTLGISVPDGSATPVDLGDVAAGSLTFAPQLGSVTVTDTRAALIADWTATASGTHFDLQTVGADPAGDVNQRVNDTAITYTAVPTTDSGTGVATPTAGTLASDLAKVVYVGSGSNAVSWNPTLSMTILPSQVAGVYQGTVTHSVTATP